MLSQTKWMLLSSSLLSVLAMANPAKAESGSASSSPTLNGPYAGINLGYSWDRDQVGSFNGSDRGSRINAPQAGVFAGYGFEFDPGMLSSLLSGYTGLEISYEKTGGDDTVAGIAVKRGSSFAATVRPGVSIGHKTLGYGIIGYKRSEFDVGGDGQWVGGWVTGAGVEFGDSGLFKTRVEFVHTDFQSRDFNLGGADTVTYKGHDNAIMLSLVRHF